MDPVLEGDKDAMKACQDGPAVLPPAVAGSSNRTKGARVDG